MEKKSQFYLQAQKYWKTVVKKKYSSDCADLQLQIDAHKRLLNIFQAGDYYFLLFDIFNGEISEISPEMESILGYSPSEMDMNLFMDSIHPQDRPYFLSFEQQATIFFNNTAIDKIGHYKVQYDLRLEKKEGDYARMLIQYVLVNFEDRNIYHSFHIHTDITHIKREGIPHCSIIGLDGEPSYYDIQDTASILPSYEIFTKREKTILKRIVEGKTSQQIADELFVSIHTINTHRKNILVKSNTVTPIQLVKKAIEEGWV